MNAFKPHIVISSGEPAGIGLDLCILLSSKKFPAFITVVGDKHALSDRASQLSKTITFHENTLIEHKGDHSLSVHHIPAKETIKTGSLNSKNNSYVLDVLNFALDRCLNKSFDALVTAPIHKSIINETQPFTGHTEYIAQYTHAKECADFYCGKIGENNFYLEKEGVLFKNDFAKHWKALRSANFSKSVN